MELQPIFVLFAISSNDDAYIDKKAPAEEVYPLMRIKDRHFTIFVGDSFRGEHLLSDEVGWN